MKDEIIRKNILISLLTKEFKQLFRDKRMLFMLFGIPVVMLLLFGYAVNTDVKKIKMAIYDEDMSAESRTFIERFTASGYFTADVYLDSTGVISGLLDRGMVDMYMHLKKDFAKNVRRGKTTEIQIILDGTDSSRASVIIAYLNQVTADFSSQFYQKKISMQVAARGIAGMNIQKKIKLKERVFFNPNLIGKDFYLPGVLGLLIALITIMLTSMAVVKERESGTMEQIIVSPLTSIEFIAGKTIPFAIIALFDIFVITIIAIAWFNVPFEGSFIFLMFSSICYILSTLAVGLYISTISKTQQQAMLSTFLFFVPSILFSGFVFPVYSMPFSIQVITLFNPMRYFIEIVRGLFLKGIGMAELWIQVMALITLGGLLFFLSVKRFTRRME